MYANILLFTVLALDKLQNLQPEPTAVQPDITLRKILLGQSYSLEPYKSLASKTALLDAAIISGDGNAILVVIVLMALIVSVVLLKIHFIHTPIYISDYIISYKNS